ncbi:AbrB/MazE/SpoVT family DNA-binding domain-containing protein [Bacillaceae bacterium]
MKATGIVRRVDELGRLVIPMEIRRTFEIGHGTPIEFFVNGQQIVLQKYATGCFLCGDNEAVLYTHERSGKRICGKCIDEIA